MSAILLKLLQLYVTFCKFGALCFGGGYVLTPLYIAAFVDVPGGISMHEFGNLLALTQMTPGPIGINAATFFGFRLMENAGMRPVAAAGAAVATIGLLTPSFFLLVFALRSLARWREHRIVQGFLGGVAPMSVALLAVAALLFLEVSVFTGPIPWKVFFGESAPSGFGIRWFALLLVAASAWTVLKTRLNIVLLILLCAFFGALVFPFIRV
ncbi:MAG: chromate transporter [Kiritimatiellae bacterium]|nr:chromate transporter [Kiritimatiellia bacterium]